LLYRFPGRGETGEHLGKMVLLTMIARLADGLPLAASMQEDEQVHISAFLPLCVDRAATVNASVLY